MTYRHLQKRLREARKLDDTVALASQIWLAGLGALARAQQEGCDYFDQLVACGEVVEAIEHDDLHNLKRLARQVLARPSQDHSAASTPEEIRSLMTALRDFDLHLSDPDIR